MFRTFIHINEYQEDGWRLVPALCALSDELTLWAPSGTLLQSAFENGSAPFSPNDLLAAIERGKIRVAAREWWLDGKKLRSRDLEAGEFPGRVWLEGF